MRRHVCVLSFSVAAQEKRGHARKIILVRVSFFFLSIIVAVMESPCGIRTALGEQKKDNRSREVHARAGSTAVNPLFIIDVRFSYHPDIFRSTDNLICGKINIKT